MLLVASFPNSEFARAPAKHRILPWRIGLKALRLTAVLVLIAAITFLCYRLIPVYPTTVAFAYLITILVIATGWGFWEALTASLGAVTCFNFFFLPPVGTRLRGGRCPERRDAH